MKLNQNLTDCSFYCGTQGDDSVVWLCDSFVLVSVISVRLH